MINRILLPTVLAGVFCGTQAFAEDPNPTTAKNQVDAFIASTTKKWRSGSVL
jgi:hypothetical protein